MKNITNYFSAAAVLLLPTLAAHAEDTGLRSQSRDSGWQIQAAGYLWLPETRSEVSTDFGDVAAKLSAADALDALDLGAMIAVNAQKGNWALAADLFYLDLTLESSTPLGLLYSDVEVRNQLSSLSGYGLYTVHEADALRLEVGGGLRLMSADVDITLHGNAVRDRHPSISDDWADVVAVARTTAKLTDTLKGVLWLEAGGFDMGGSASHRTWQVSAMIDWQINDTWTIGAGYRALDVDRENDGVPYELRLSGPILGMMLRF